jgi:hypothetical protein
MSSRLELDFTAPVLGHLFEGLTYKPSVSTMTPAQIRAMPGRMPSTRSRRRWRRASPTARTCRRHPSGRSVALPLMTSFKASLYRTLRESSITRAELMRRLGWNRNSVDRLFRLDHASRLHQIEAAFKALGKSVALEVEQGAKQVGK